MTYEKDVIQFLKSYIDVICLWSSGNIMLLLPYLVKVGFNCLMPLEKNAEVDASEIKEEYDKVVLIGNIFKKALIEEKRAIGKEVESKIQLIKEGGYTPTIDDIVPLEVPLEIIFTT